MSGQPDGSSCKPHILSYLFFHPCWPSVALSRAHPSAATQSRRSVVVNSPPPYHCVYGAFKRGYTVPTFPTVEILLALKALGLPFTHWHPHHHYYPPPCHRYHQISLAEATATNTIAIASPFGAIAVCSPHHTFLIIVLFSCSAATSGGGGALHSTLTPSLPPSQHLSRPSLVKGPPGRVANWRWIRNLLRNLARYATVQWSKLGLIDHFGPFWFPFGFIANAHFADPERVPSDWGEEEAALCKTELGLGERECSNITAEQQGQSRKAQGRMNHVVVGAEGGKREICCTVYYYMCFSEQIFNDWNGQQLLEVLRQIRWLKNWVSSMFKKCLLLFCTFNIILFPKTKAYYYIFSSPLY